MSARDESPHTLAESWCEVCCQFCYPPIEGAITNLCGCCDARVRADERERILTEDQALGSLVRKDQDAITRERIAQEIEAQHGGVMCYHAPAAGMHYVVCTHAQDARIARGDTPTRDQ